jgi:hypothetical protein
MTVFRTSVLCFAATLLGISAFAADQVQTATLKDLKTVGTTSKKQKHQQYDMVVDTSNQEFTCRTKLGSSFNATEYAVGSPLQFKVSGQKGEVTNAAGKKTKCAIVRVGAPGAPYSPNPQ